MTRRLISNGSEFEEKFGYSRAVVDDDMIFVSGTTGYDYTKMTISDDVVEQANQCFINIEEVLQQAGGAIADIVRVTYILPNRDDFFECLPIFQKWLGQVRPAATMFVAGLVNDDMKIEIQVTAKKSSKE